MDERMQAHRPRARPGPRKPQAIHRNTRIAAPERQLQGAPGIEASGEVWNAFVGLGGRPHSLVANKIHQMAPAWKTARMNS